MLFQLREATNCRWSPRIAKTVGLLGLLRDENEHVYNSRQAVNRNRNREWSVVGTLIQAHGTVKSCACEEWTRILHVKEILQPSAKLEAIIREIGGIWVEDSMVAFRFVKCFKDTVAIVT